MRTQSAGESTLLAGANYAIFQRVKVKNGAISGSSTLIDYSDYVERVTVDEDIDQPTAQATVEFRRDASSTVSLAPLRTDSTLNVAFDGVTYSPALDAGRQITIEVATVAIGSTPAAGDWKLLFKGYVDSVDAASPTVRIVCRDEGGILVDRWVETEAPYGYDTAMETVIQQLLDNTLGVSDAPALYTPVSPSFLQRTYTQASEPVMDALVAFVQQIGWDVRYRWDNGTSAFRLTLYAPPRSNTTPDRTFGPATYFDVSRLTLDRAGVRNYITVNHRVAPGGTLRTDTAISDATSIARYGRRFFGITESDESSVDTAGEATTLITAILSDLKDPKAEMEIEAQFFWPAQLHDLYRFSTNAVHFNTNQDWAVTNIRHELYRGTGRTYLQVRGTPAGGYLTWQARRDNPIQPPSRPLFNGISNFRETARSATAVTVGWSAETTALEYWVWLSTPAQPIGTDPYLALVGAPYARLTAASTSYEVTVPQQGLITYGRLAPVYANGLLGRTWDFTVQPGTAERLIQRVSITSATATGLVITVAVANPTTGSDILVTPVVSGCTVAEGAQTILAANVTDNIATTGTVVFTVTKGSGAGAGRITFTATSTDRLPDVDAVDVPSSTLTPPAPITKVMTLPAATFSILDSSDTDAFTNTPGGLHVTSGDREFVSAAVLPPGVTITAVTLYGRRLNNTTGRILVRTEIYDPILGGLDIETETELAAGTSDGTAGASDTDSGLSIAVGSGGWRTFGARIWGPAKLFYVTITYTMPTYDKTL